MKSIECALQGTLGRDPTRRTSASGRDWVSFSVAVGEEADLQWVDVAAFGPNVDVAGALIKGDRVYIEGRIKLRTWQNNDGSMRSTLSVSASLVQPLGKIGAQKPKKPRAAKAEKPKVDPNAPIPFNDALPF
jgi:single stranded DNA-binding protein